LQCSLIAFLVGSVILAFSQNNVNGKESEHGGLAGERLTNLRPQGGASHGSKLAPLLVLTRFGANKQLTKARATG
jgi:hypothetical protein